MSLRLPALCIVSLSAGWLTCSEEGEVFFATAKVLSNAFDFFGILEKVVLDVHACHFWEITALDRVALKSRHHDIPVEIVGLNEMGTTRIDRLGAHYR